MEPAIDRREHAVQRGKQMVPDVALQWSPPLNGGNSTATVPAGGTATKLQWSPPVTGGSTPGA